MKNPALKAPAAGQSIGSIVRRVALPFLLFAAMLFGFLSISWYLLLPKLTQVEVAGKKHDSVQLKIYVSQLEADVLEMEGVRAQLVTPLREGLYGSAKEYKSALPPDFLSLRSQVVEVAVGLVPDRRDAVEISTFDYVPSGNVLGLSGEVRNVGPRSMTVLAQFIDEIKNLPCVSSVDLPRFTRVHDPEKGYVSPFDFKIFLK